MDILKNLLPFVNEQITIQKKLVEKYPEEWRKSLHSETEKKFASMADDIQTAIIEYAKLEDEYLKLKEKYSLLETLSDDGNFPEKSKNTYQLLALNHEELANLPDDLLEELSESAKDKTEVRILELIAENGGIISLDQLLVRLYNKFGEKFKRKELTTRLYKMVQAEVLYSTPGKKGVYSTSPIDIEKASKVTDPLDF